MSDGIGGIRYGIGIGYELLTLARVLSEGGVQVCIC